MKSNFHHFTHEVLPCHYKYQMDKSEKKFREIANEAGFPEREIEHFVEMFLKKRKK